MPYIETLPSFSALARLEELVVDNCPKLQSITSIADARALTTLRVGNLHPDQSADIIGELPDVIGELPNLQFLNLSKKDFSKEQIAELQRIRPKLKIVIQ